MKKFDIKYDYVVHRISEGNSIGYKAVIPAFNSVVFGDNLVELEKGISLAIQEEIKARKSARKGKQTIPAPDSIQKFSGKFVMRINPFLHEKIALEAKARGKSLNSYLQEKLTALL